MRIPHHVWKEASRLIRFGVIGGVSFALFALLYAALSRWLWTSGNRTLENFLATIIASTFNYLAHRTWTFKVGGEGRHLKHIGRYLFVVGTAMGIQLFFFWLGHEVFHFFDFAVAIALQGFIPIYTYLMHRFFTFRETRLAVLL